MKIMPLRVEEVRRKRNIFLVKRTLLLSSLMNQQNLTT